MAERVLESTESDALATVEAAATELIVELQPVAVRKQTVKPQQQRMKSVIFFYQNTKSNCEYECIHAHTHTHSYNIINIIIGNQW